MNEWVKMIFQVLCGLVALIPLVIELVKYVTIAIKEKNWKNLLPLVYEFMAVAETKFEDGKERKEWVLDKVIEAAKSINYDVDREAVSDLIESAIELTKKINTEMKK